MRKTIVYFAHPAHRHSIANAKLADVARTVDEATVGDLYAEYPRTIINVDLEQARLLTHDNVVIQFPFMWYSTPSILKEWQDLVLKYGFAYGAGGDKLTGKHFLAVVSAGGPDEPYHPDGFNRFEMRTLLSPLEQTATLCGMRFVAPYVLFAAFRAGKDDRLADHAVGYRQLLESLRDETHDLDTADQLGLLSATQLPISNGVAQ